MRFAYVLTEDWSSTGFGNWNPSKIISVYSNINAANSWLNHQIQVMESIGYKISRRYEHEEYSTVIMVKEKQGYMLRLFKKLLCKYEY